MKEIRGLARCEVKVARAAALAGYQAGEKEHKEAREAVIAELMQQRVWSLFSGSRPMTREEAERGAECFEEKLRWCFAGEFDRECAEKVFALCNATTDDHIWLGTDLAGFVARYRPAESPPSDL